MLGPEGVGKSRLCRQLALVRHNDESLVGGVWLASPARTTLDGVVRAVAEALSVRLAAADTVTNGIVRIGHALASRGRTLVVIDGVETPTAALTQAVETWLTIAPKAS